jgi:Transcriptional regulator containing PAS, AAA-type ATPase, and DNA-binding domains
VTVKPNTAFGLALCALALMTAPRDDASHRARIFVASVAAALAAIIGGATALEYVTGRDFGIDQLLISAAAEAASTATPGRMAAVTAVSLMTLGTGIFLNIHKVSRTAGVCQILMVAAGSLSLTFLLGYAYGAIATAGLGEGIQIAIPTALAIVLLSAGALALRPDIGWVATLRSDNAGGVLARRMLPFVVLVPFTLGAFRVLGSWTAPFSVATQTAVVAILTMLSFAIVVWRTALSLDIADRERRLAERDRLLIATQEEAARGRADAEHTGRAVAEEARDLAELASKEKAEALALLEIVLSTAPIGFAMFDRQARYVRVNKTLAEMNGLAEEAHYNKTPSDIVPDISKSAESVIHEVFRTQVPVVNVPFTRLTPASPAAPAGERPFSSASILSRAHQGRHSASAPSSSRRQA